MVFELLFFKLLFNGYMTSNCCYGKSCVFLPIGVATAL